MWCSFTCRLTGGGGGDWIYTPPFTRSLRVAYKLLSFPLPTTDPLWGRWGWERSERTALEITALRELWLTQGHPVNPTVWPVSFLISRKETQIFLYKFHAFLYWSFFCNKAYLWIYSSMLKYFITLAIWIEESDGQQKNVFHLK